jgi:hypothetical protein
MNALCTVSVENHLKKLDIGFDESQKSQIYAAVGEIDAAADMDLPKGVR